MGMVTILFETGGREGFEPINDSRPSLCATVSQQGGLLGLPEHQGRMLGDRWLSPLQPWGFEACLMVPRRQ